MKSLLLIFSFLTITATSINVIGSKEDKMITSDKEFKQLMKDFNNTLDKNKKVQIKADETKDKIIVSTTNKINQLSNENKLLKNDINELKSMISIVKIDTIYIHDTIQVKEKKNFWGKTKIDTTAN
jgi:Sec-independent protein translocase protein TatA